MINNLPTEFLSASRFFAVGKKKSDVPKAWSNPDNQVPAALAVQRTGRIGFDISGHNRGEDFLFLDFDHVLNDDGEFVNEDAHQWFTFVQSSLDGYCERSVSGRGLHIFAVPTPNKFLPVSNGKNGVLWFDKATDCKLELFYKPAGRYCLLTGDIFNCSPRAPIPSGVAVDDVFQRVIDEIKTRQSPVDTTPRVSDTNDSAIADDREYDLFRAGRMLNVISPAELDDTDWLAVMSACKNIGLPYSAVDTFNRLDPNRYNEKENQTRWDSLNDPAFNIQTLHGIAKRFGYDEKSTWHEYHGDYPSSLATEYDELDSRIAAWQEVNGAIAPAFLAQMRAQAARIEAVTDLAAAARDTTTQKFLGAFVYYSFFSDVTENFFARLLQAKAAAKAKIAEYKKLVANAAVLAQIKGAQVEAEINDAAPTEQESSLNNLIITPIKNSVATFKTQAKRDHKKYLEKREIDEVNAKIQAERDAYKEAPPSTQDSVPDCPVDLTLPHGVFLDDDGIRIIDFDKPVGKFGRPVVEACQNPVVPVKLLRETNSNFTQYEVAIKTDNVWRYAIFDGRTIQDARAISELSNYGAHISNPRAFAQYFAKIIAVNERNGKLKRIRVYKQPGWADKECTEFIYPTGGDDYIVKNGEFDYEGVFTPHGDKDKFLKMFNRVLFHNPKRYISQPIYDTDKDGNQIIVTPDNISSNVSSVPNLVAAMTIGFAAGAPLIKPLGLRNPQMVFGFNSGNGKTAAAKFAVSLFGRPENGLAPTLNATANYLEDLAAKVNDFPHVVDELQAAKKKVRENMDELVYNFSGGTTRGRADIKGNARPTFHYRGCRMFTGEQTITNDSSGQGAISRVFEIKKSDLFADPFAVEIHNFTLDNYGHLGKFYYTEFIPHNLARIRNFFEHLKNGFGSKELNLLSSHATQLAFAITGLRFALEALGYTNADEIVGKVIEAADELIKDAPTKTQAKNINRALPELFNFVKAFPKNFSREATFDGQTTINSADAFETYGIILKDGKIAFNPYSLKKIIGTELNFPNARQIIDGFGEAGFFDSGNAKDKKYMKRLPARFADHVDKKTWYYILKSPDELEEITSAA